MTTTVNTNELKYDVDIAVRVFGEMMKSAGIPYSHLLAVFPNRPTTKEECSEIAVWVATQVNLRKGALAKLARKGKPRYTVPVQTNAYPTPAQRAAIDKIAAKKELTEADDKVLAHALANCKTNASVQGIFDFLRERPWKGSTPTPTAPSQPAPQAMTPGKKTPVGKLGVKLGRYAVVFEGKERLFKVHVTKKGFTKISVKSSNDWYEISNFAKVKTIVEAILVDPEAAGMRYGELDRCCRKCGKELSDVDNPYFNSWLGPECGDNW